MIHTGTRSLLVAARYIPNLFFGPCCTFLAPSSEVEKSKWMNDLRSAIERIKTLRPWNPMVDSLILLNSMWSFDLQPLPKISIIQLSEPWTRKTPTRSNVPVFSIGRIRRCMSAGIEIYLYQWAIIISREEINWAVIYYENLRIPMVGKSCGWCLRIFVYSFIRLIK